MAKQSMDYSFSHVKINIDLKLLDGFREMRISIIIIINFIPHFQILYKVWPSMNQFVRQLCKQSIEPSIVEKLTEYKIKGFQFDRLVLGRIVSLF